MNTTIVMVAYKSEHLIQKNIEKIDKKIKVIIIDNSENKDFKKQIETKHENISIVLNKNRGFGQAANLGASLVKTKYILFCSPDNFVEKDAANKLENTAYELNDNFGILILSDKNQSLYKRTEIKKTRGFLCSFIKKEVFFDISGFDEKFFLYYEDNDLIKRILKKKIKNL